MSRWYTLREVHHGADHLFPWYRFDGALRLLVPRDGYKARSLPTAMDVAGRNPWAAWASGLGIAAEKELTRMPRGPKGEKKPRPLQKDR